MKKKTAAVITSIIAASLVLNAYQPSDAQVYSGHDGSVDDRMEKITAEPIRGKNGLWYYLTKICADDYPMAISSVTIKSDIEQKSLGFNTLVKKGDCTYAGAVIKAIDGNTLGAEMIERHEAIERMIEIGRSMSDIPTQQKQNAIKEFMQLYKATGFVPRF